MSQTFNVCVVGAGYVGLVTGACLAQIGHKVTCVDKDEGRISSLKEGRMPFYESGLEKLIDESTRRRRLCFAANLAEVIPGADVVFIAVGTPQGDDGFVDLSGVAGVARSIGKSLSLEIGSERTRPLGVVNKSTVPVGTGNYVSMFVQEGATEGGSGDNVSCRVVSNPEFLREGSAVYDTLFPDRILLGADQRDALDMMRALYEPIIEQSFSTQLDPRPKAAVPCVTTNLASAEMIKYATNAFLATKISFTNEIATICELVGADVSSVAHGIGLDERIGSRFLRAGIGWGGSGFLKDLSVLRSIAREYDYEPALLNATVAINDRQRKQVISKLQRELHTLKGKRIALLGLAYKPNTDDLREAPSLQIAEVLEQRGAQAVGYDPVAAKKASKLLPSLKAVFDPYEALYGAHAVVLITEWDEFRELSLERAASLMKPPRLLVDGRNAIDPEAAASADLLYRGFGRG